MEIFIAGGRSRQQGIVRDMCEYLGEKLLGPRMSSKLTLWIYIKKLEDGFQGFVTWEDCNIRPREFTMELDNRMSDEELMLTVAHEMVHIKQDVRGQKRERYDRLTGTQQTYWLGEDHSKTPYKKQPWEKEAYKLQGTLKKQFLKESDWVL